MKNYITISIVLFFFLTTLVKAQVGPMTNNPNNNAVLDLNTSTGTNTKGLLLPKVTLEDLSNPSPMTEHTEGLQIYNTKTVGTGALQASPGIYYNDGTQWVNSSSGWETSGNGSTTVTENYIGTNTATDFPVRTNDTERMRINSNGQVLVGTSSVPTGGNNSRFIIDNGTTAGALQIKSAPNTNKFVLVSDNNGVGQWKDKSVTPIIIKSGYKSTNLKNADASNWKSIGVKIVLSPGKWLITMTHLITTVIGKTASNESWWVRSTFSDSSTAMAVSPDIVSSCKYIGGLLPPNSTQNNINGSLIIDNTTDSDKTYYYIGGYVTSINGNVSGIQVYPGYQNTVLIATLIN